MRELLNESWVRETERDGECEEGKNRERCARLGKLSDNANLVLVRKLICKHNVLSSNKSRNGSQTYPPTRIQPNFFYPLPSSFLCKAMRAACQTSRSFGFLAPRNGHLFRRLQRLLFVKSCFQTAVCVLSVRNPKLSCGICFFLLQKVRISHCLLMEWGFVVCMARHGKATFFQGSSIVSPKRISKPTPARI